MSETKEIQRAHPKGEEWKVVDSYGGVVQVGWDPEAEVTPYGQLVFFVEFLKTAGLFESWVSDCPLSYRSNNQSSARDVLGTTMLSVLAGHNRYAHITSIRSDRVTPELLGMTKVVSEDSVRRAFKAMGGEACEDWLKRHLKNCTGEVLREPWVLDVDTTVKPVYGHQEGAVLGYNPQKPGRPSHVYHTYFVGTLRMILDVEVQPGNQSATSYAQPGLWKYIDELPEESRPAFVRGDCAWGNENVMREAEERKIGYVFKLKKTANVKRLIYAAFKKNNWVDAGQGWEGVEDRICLSGWTRDRRVIVLRRPIKEPIVAENPESKLPQLTFLEIDDPMVKYEFAILITSLPDEILTVAQHYRNRADIENVFDEMKNQWGWGGFMTQDIERCKIMARVTALVFNWWSLFSGLAFPDRHAEAITSRPLLLHAVGRQTRHAGQKLVTITSTHGEHGVVRKMLAAASKFLGRLKAAAEQLTSQQRWQLMLSRIFVRFLRGRILGIHPPQILQLMTA